MLAPPEVLVRHLEAVVRRRAAALLTREQVARMLEALRDRSPSLVQEVRDRLPLGQVQRVLQELLAANLAIRDLEGILEALTDETAAQLPPPELTEHVRGRLGGLLGQGYCDAEGRLWCVRVAPQAEGRFVSDRAGEPAEALRSSLARGVAQLKQRGRRPVVLCPPASRSAVRRLVAAAHPDAAVLSYGEVEQARVEPVLEIGADDGTETL